ncbi:carbonic anhydrase/acetyltransferase [Alkalicella caledoniensis]|uniref:Carbonic anhydrase/acetyltransferase n=1 Tax=Alkalicella caledoniensis TaxID=2731377 RepID=A0A7G9WAY2_ALKCA|nr:DapH/DapD/GlmU-related protein [Alkalicella caledoniensis]QNO15844.1 carbonic anhydrase/acetyltransferase [Alkalicella caledoniensis]
MSNLKVASSAKVIGQALFGKGVYIAQGAVVRSENNSVQLGNHSWVLENSTIIGTQDNPVIVGSKTVFGHKCVAIGAQIGDLCEIGNGTIFMPGCKVGDMCITGESTIIPSDMIIPDESVVVGRPARIIRKLTEQDKERIKTLRGNNITIMPFEEGILDIKRQDGDKMSKLHEVNGKFPNISSSTKVHHSAEINGDVIIGDDCVIGPGVKIIGDTHGPVRIGNNVQILENCVLHLLPDNELIIEDNVIIGPSSIIHGTVIGHGTIIESGVNISDYSKIGINCMVKAGSLVKQRSEFPDNSIIEGFPAKKLGTLETKQTTPPWVYK